MEGYSRTQRVGDQIQRELASLIQLEMKDPRIGMVTVNAVEVSRDLAHAEVYVTALGAEQPQERQKIEHTLNHASGFLRRRLAQLIQLRIVPDLRFHYDESIARGARLSSLIDQALAEDAKRGQGMDETN